MRQGRRSRLLGRGTQVGRGPKQDRQGIESLLTQPPFAPPKRHRRHPGAYDVAVGWMLDWLLDQPGDTWQDRWLASGADADGRRWRHIPVAG